MTTGRPVRRVSRLGLVLTLAIVLAVIAFGLFKRKGARKPPPIPEDASGRFEGPRVPFYNEAPGLKA